MLFEFLKRVGDFNEKRPLKFVDCKHFNQVLLEYSDKAPLKSITFDEIPQNLVYAEETIPKKLSLKEVMLRVIAYNRDKLEIRENASAY